ncbi:MAG: putative metal-binding motif-containing protein [Myxococcota bacterium]
MRTSMLLMGPLLFGCGDKDDETSDTAEGVIDDGEGGIPDLDGDGFNELSDCDDLDEQVYPGAPEICDKIDNDCDGLVDDADPIIDESTADTFYADTDNDNFGDPDVVVLSCDRPEGTVVNASDCDDTNGDVFPNASEVCNGIDDDCDEAIDDSDDDLDLTTTTSAWLDSDSDDYGNPEQLIQRCAIPDGYVPDDTDCDDANSQTNPAATEICNTIDDDCDEAIDDNDDSLDRTTGTVYYFDGDEDTYGDPGDAVQTCLPPTGYVGNDRDCDDDTAAVNPDAEEICNGIDDDCDTFIDDDDESVDGSTYTTYYRDGDSDGFGRTDDTRAACDQPAGYAAVDGDCDDGAAAVNPDAEEVCNTVDDDCDDAIDDDDDDVDEDTFTDFYQDSDGDEFGDPDVSTAACASPPGYVEDNTDCDDTSALIHPDADELCDGEDTDCDATTSEDGAITLDGSASYDTIQEALDAADADAEIVLCDGTYSEDLETDVALTLTGRNGAAVTTIQGSGSGAVITTGAALTLTGLTITGGDASEGGGVDGITNDAGPLTIADCVISDNNATITGGGISGPLNYALTVTDTDVTNNTVTRIGGGIYMSDGTLSGVTLEDNEALNGGGLYVEGGTVTVDASTTITSNDAVSTSTQDSFGGGVFVQDATVTFNAATEISENTADYGAGGFAYQASTVSGGAWTENIAGEDGGGLYIGSGGATLSDATVSDNLAPYAGGVFLTGAPSSLTDTDIRSNEGSTFGGGLIIFGDFSDALVIDVSGGSIDDNTAPFAGGVHIESVSATFDGTTITNNTATNPGGGMYLFEATVSIENGAVEGNTASIGGGAYLDQSTLTAVNSDWGASTATDNDPDDVYVSDLSTAYSSYGTAEDFVCSDADGCPE